MISVFYPRLAVPQDHGPTEPGASQLALASRMKRKHSATKVAGGGKGGPAMTEDEEMEMAIAMSMQGGSGEGGEAGTSGAGGGGLDEDDDVEEEEIYRKIREAEASVWSLQAAKKSPEQVRSGGSRAWGQGVGAGCAGRGSRAWGQGVGAGRGSRAWEQGVGGRLWCV